MFILCSILLYHSFIHFKIPMDCVTDIDYRVKQNVPVCIIIVHITNGFDQYYLLGCGAP
jgi:hypothetical protein